MMSELELKVVDESKVWGTAAKHMCIILDYGEFEKSIERGKFPEKSAVEETFGIEFYRGYCVEFNATYFHDLPIKEVNPLKVEQEGWRSLSPVIREYLDQVDNYLQGYPPSVFNEDTKKEFLGYLNRGNELLDKWQIVCNSYKAKYERGNEKRIQQTEAAVQVLIQELSSRSP